MTVAQRYLDLLKRCLLREIFMSEGDPLREARIKGLDWPGDGAETMIGRHRLDNVQACVESVLQDRIPGDLLEAGVWRGGASIFMRGILEAYDDRHRSVWLADSFEGLPPPDPQFPADAGSIWHLERVLAVGVDAVRENFDRYRLLDERVHFLPGWFKDTLHCAPVAEIAVLRLDGDLYQSTWETLEALYRKVSAGGYVIVDDYGSVDTCRLAVDDFRTREAITDEIHVVDCTGVYWRKS